ncbi:hypothetical protein K2173_011453 [Erythroxylum novogranatense]|uniref:Uncharacterized protein n=1 Tax=Erythroxylum novogranatense TaxID=1862640 RepID=A0AAV8TEQ2_9ROSI|nr:hypothetical protein K2173_011453 [Erythroxylum novogranatense]
MTKIMFVVAELDLTFPFLDFPRCLLTKVYGHATVRCQCKKKDANAANEIVENLSPGVENSNANVPTADNKYGPWMIAKGITKPRIQKQSSNVQKPIVVTRSSFDALEIEDIKNTDYRVEADTGAAIATTLPPIAPSSKTKDKGKKVAIADISNLPKAKTTISNHQAKSLSTKQPTMQNPKPTTYKSKHMPNLTLSPSIPNPKPTSPMQTKLQNPPRKNVTGPNKHHSRLSTFTLGDFMDFKNNLISVETTVPLPTILNPKTNSVVGKPSKQADPKPGLPPATPNDIDLAIVSKENVISGRLPDLPAPVMDDVMGECESSIGMEHDSKNVMNDEDNAQSSVNIRV